eukprot:gene11418-4585_t
MPIKITNVGSSDLDIILKEMKKKSDNFLIINFVQFKNIISDTFDDFMTPAKNKIDFIPAGKVCVSFADLVTSTVLWKKYPNEMEIFIETFEEKIESFLMPKGRSVKFIGDSSMAVFEEIQDAIDFTIKVQKYNWNLNENVQSLSFKIGISCGPCFVKYNIVNNKIDYFGSIVNLPARLEGASCSGIIFVQCSTTNVFHLPEGFKQEILTNRTFKGFDDEEFDIWAIREADTLKSQRFYLLNVKEEFKLDMKEKELKNKEAEYKLKMSQKDEELSEFKFKESEFELKMLQKDVVIADLNQQIEKLNKKRKAGDSDFENQGDPKIQNVQVDK